MSEHTLRFPSEIEKEIGLSGKEINLMKTKGCRFYGRKTCVAWVREWLQKTTELESGSELHAHRQPIGASK